MNWSTTSWRTLRFNWTNSNYCLFFILLN